MTDCDSVQLRALFVLFISLSSSVSRVTSLKVTDDDVRESLRHDVRRRDASVRSAPLGFDVDIDGDDVIVQTLQGRLRGKRRPGYATVGKHIYF